MEKLVEPLRVAHAPLRPAQLPPPQVLAQHLDTCEVFQTLLTENTAFLTPDNLRSLAAAFAMAGLASSLCSLRRITSVLMGRMSIQGHRT